eukprot:6189630-Pleurochrysis_carterae.AAC.3
MDVPGQARVDPGPFGGRLSYGGVRVHPRMHASTQASMHFSTRARPQDMHTSASLARTLARTQEHVRARRACEADRRAQRLKARRDKGLARRERSGANVAVRERACVRVARDASRRRNQTTVHARAAFTAQGASGRRTVGAAARPWPRPPQECSAHTRPVETCLSAANSQLNRCPLAPQCAIRLQRRSCAAPDGGNNMARREQS